MNNRSAVRGYMMIIVLLAMSILVHGQAQTTFRLTSPSFEEGKAIPAKYTCDSSNVSPALRWTGAPVHTKSFAIIMDDQDTPMGAWVHWVIYNIPGTLTSLDERITAAQVNAIEGMNSWSEKVYNGPCPPGGAHRYQFKLFALDQMMPIKEEMTKDDLLDAMKGHILGEATLTGLFRM